MGGLSFRQKLGIEGKRLSNEDYFNVAAEAIHNLSNLFQKNHLVRAYYSKKDHGDQDWIASGADLLKGSIKSQIQQSFNLPNELINQNSNCYSILLNGFQVDFTVVDFEYFLTSCFYMDDSCAGNAVGKLYHKFGASYGYNGLYYTLRDNHNTYKLGQIPISTDNEKICDFLGLNYSRKVAGFYEEKDIFDWIVSSKYFDHRIFSWEEMNHRARVRDKKRPDYKRLMNYIEKFKNKEYNFPLKSDGVGILNEFFPEAKLVEKINKLKEKESKRQELITKFNGNLLMDWVPGLQGKELGQVLSEFKYFPETIGYKNYPQYLELCPADKIKKDFLEWFSCPRGI